MTTPVKANAHVYCGGASEAFAPGTIVPLPDKHADALKKSGHVKDHGEKHDPNPRAKEVAEDLAEAAAEAEKAAAARTAEQSKTEEAARANAEA